MMAEEYNKFKPSLVLKHFHLVCTCSLYWYRNIWEAEVSDLIFKIHLMLVIWWTTVSLVNIHFHFSVTISQQGSQLVWNSISRRSSLRVDSAVVALAVILYFSIQRENTTTLHLLVTVDNNRYIPNSEVKTETPW